MLETELKCLISKEVYEKIKASYKWDSEKIQENHYYTDKNGVLSANRTVFRIRLKDGAYKIQVKAHKNENSPLQICEETEFEYTGAPDTISADEGMKYTGLNTGELVKIGYNTTVRSSLMWNDHTEICLDRTDYFDVTDYEIEVEYSGERPDELISGLKAAGAGFSEPSVGKYTRFVRRLNSIINE